MTTLFAVCLMSALLPAPQSAADGNEESLVVKIGGCFTIDTFRDIPYVDCKDADSRKQKLDLFVPKGQKDFPVLFFIHGGGWTSGDRKLYSNVGRIFAKNGVGTVVISYRLTPQVHHPEHIQDVAKAFAWTYANIGKYGGRNDQIFVSGQSAGGQLAALLATNEKYLAAEKLSLKNIKGVMPISGIYEFPYAGYERMLGKNQDATDASPLKQVTGKEPPFLILYADKDLPNCDLMAKNLCQELQNKKVEASCQEIPHRTHISIMLLLMVHEGDPTTQALLAFIAKHSDMKLTDRAESPEK